MLQMDKQLCTYSCKVLALLVLAHAASWPAESRSAGQFDFPQLLCKAWGQRRWEGEWGACSWLVLAYSTEAEFTHDNCTIPGSNFLHVQALHLNGVLMYGLGLDWALWNLLCTKYTDTMQDGWFLSNAQKIHQGGWSTVLWEKGIFVW